MTFTKNIFATCSILYSDEKMAENWLIAGVACLFIAIVLYVISTIASEVSAISFIGSGVFLILGIACLGVWVINRMRK